MKQTRLSILYASAYILLSFTGIPNNLYIYGQEQEFNETLEYKYATPDEKLRIEFQNLRYDCIARAEFGVTFILMLDKCKPIVEFEEKNNGLRVDTIGQTFYNELDDIKEDLIRVVDERALTYDGEDKDIYKAICITEMFEWHVLLNDNAKCQRVIEYYLSIGWSLVDKYDEKVEFVKGNITK